MFPGLLASVVLLTTKVTATAQATAACTGCSMIACL